MWPRSCVVGGQSRGLGGDHLPALGRQFGAVAGAFDDDLVRGIGQAVQCGVSEDWIINEAEPLIHAAVASERESAATVAFDDELVQVLALLSGQAAE